MSTRRTRAVVLAIGLVAVVGLLWGLGRADKKRAVSETRGPLVCGVPTSLFAQPPRPLDNSQAADEVRRDPSLRASSVPKLWRMYEDGDRRLYVAGNPPVVHVTSLERQGAKWKWSGGGGCTTFVEPGGRASAIWAIPDGGVDRAARSFDVAVTDRQCASGRSAEERVNQAKVIETEKSVTVTFSATRLDGFQNCPSHTGATRTVTLLAPLGDRVLLDGGIYPPTSACVVGGPPPQPDYCETSFFAFN